MSSAIWIAT